MSLVRLDKFLTMNGICTRSEAKKLLKTARVTVNGIPEKKGEVKIEIEKDLVCLDGESICYEPFLCLMFHKPAGCITATEDKKQKTVLDYIEHDRKSELFPVGRLDIDTEGLLFLMNDGELSHRMLSPRHHVEKTYFARVDGCLSEDDIEAFKTGVDIGEEKQTLPAELKILSSGDVSSAELTICEGKFHQVKRMFEARGNKVTYLKRISMAGISLDASLAPGAWRLITEEEKEILNKLRK